MYIHPRGGDGHRRVFYYDTILVYATAFVFPITTATSKNKLSYNVYTLAWNSSKYLR